MNRMVVYEVRPGFDDPIYYATKAQALTVARETASGKHGDMGDVEVWARYIRADLKRRPLHAVLLNRGDWYSDSELVARLQSKGGRRWLVR